MMHAIRCDRYTSDFLEASLSSCQTVWQSQLNLFVERLRTYAVDLSEGEKSNALLRASADCRQSRGNVERPVLTAHWPSDSRRTADEDRR